jgi:hypothetical protein
MFGFHFSQLANYALMPVHQAMPLVRREAELALAIDPSLPDAHAMLGLVAALYDYDWGEASRQFALAMAADPIPSEVRRHYALYYLLPTGRYTEAAAECGRALEEDPLNIMGRLRFAQCLRAAGRIDEGYRELRHALELDDRLWFTQFLLGLDHLLDDQQVKALDHAERAYALAPWNPSARGLLASALRIAGELRRSEELLQLLEADPAGPAALGLATFYLAGSDVDACADWTERAIAERHPAIFYFLHAHALTLRRSSRWPRLLQLLNLPEPR